MSQSEDDARPTFLGASLVEAVGILALLAGFQFAFAAAGYPQAVFEIIHRVVYIAVTAMACTWSLRLTDGFSLQNMKVTVFLVAVGIAALIVLTPADPLLVGGLVVPLAVGGLARWGGQIGWWTGTHTALLLVVLGITAVFVAAGPRPVGTSVESISLAVDVSLVQAGLESRVEFARDGATSAMHAPLALAGGLLYVVGRFVE